MKARLYCKDCKDTIVDPEVNQFRSCKCGKTQVQKVQKGYAVCPGANYCMVDDEGNEIVIKDDPTELRNNRATIAQNDSPLDDKEVFRELMLSISNQIEAMESWSSSARFSPCVNQDLLAHLIWEQSVLKTMDKRLSTHYAMCTSLGMRLQLLEDEKGKLDSLATQMSQALADLATLREAVASIQLRKKSPSTY